jgi:hypothetical protein
MVDVFTALTDELGLRNPVILVNVGACAAFLRRVKRRYLEHQLALTACLVLQKYFGRAPGGCQYGLVEPGLGHCPIAKPTALFVLFRLCLIGHV